MQNHTIEFIKFFIKKVLRNLYTQQNAQWFRFHRTMKNEKTLKTQNGANHRRCGERKNKFFFKGILTHCFNIIRFSGSYLPMSGRKRWRQGTKAEEIQAKRRRARGIAPGMEAPEKSQTHTQPPE